MPLNFSSHTQADYCCSYFNIRQFYTGSPHIFAVLFCTLCPSMVNIMYETYKVRESVWIKAFTQISQANTQPYYLRFLRVHIPLELQQYLQFCQKNLWEITVLPNIGCSLWGSGAFLRHIASMQRKRLSQLLCSQSYRRDEQVLLACASSLQLRWVHHSHGPWSGMDNYFQKSCKPMPYISLL